jgi:hypothetical protein
LAELSRYGALPDAPIDENAGLSSLSVADLDPEEVKGSDDSVPGAARFVQGVGEGIAHAFVGVVDFWIGKGPIGSIQEMAGQLANRASSPAEAKLLSAQVVNPFLGVGIVLGNVAQAVQSGDSRRIGQAVGGIAGALLIGAALRTGAKSKTAGREVGRFLSPDEFEELAQATFGGRKGRLPLNNPRPSGIRDVEVDLISDDVATQIKRITDPEAVFGGKMRLQFEMTVEAAQRSGRTKIR